MRPVAVVNDLVRSLFKLADVGCHTKEHDFKQTLESADGDTEKASKLN